jgi:lysophospholipase L1-like esterase
MTSDQVRKLMIGGGVAALAFGLVLALRKDDDGVFDESSSFNGPPLLRPRERILVLGDSFAAGLAPHLGKLAASEGHDFYGKPCNPGSVGSLACTAIVGSSVLQWNRDAWLLPILMAIKPTRVLISLGGNDFKSGPSNQEKISLAIQGLVGKIRASGAIPVWIDPLRLPFQDSAGVRDSWRSAGVPYIDNSGIDFPRAGDKIHLFPSGYQQWAAIIWDWLKTARGK